MQSLDTKCKSLQIFQIHILKPLGKLIYETYQNHIWNQSLGIKNWVKGVKIVLERCGLLGTHLKKTDHTKCACNILNTNK